MNRLIMLITVLVCLNVCQARSTSDRANVPNEASEIVDVLPSWLGEGYSVSTTDHFCVAHDTSQTEAQKLADHLEYAFQRFQHFFRDSGFELAVPENKLNWISFTDSDHFSLYVHRAEKIDVTRLSGYYSSRTNRVVMIEPQVVSEVDSSFAASQVPAEISAMTADDDPNQFVKIAHELAHQLAFNTGLQKRGVMYPLWISEGLATQYETRLSYCYTTNRARNERLMEMYHAGRLIPLNEFVSQARLSADLARCEDLYAQAWGFFDFLLENHPEKLRAYLKNYFSAKKGYRLAPVINKEFTDHFGSLDQLNAEWIQHLQSR